MTTTPVFALKGGCVCGRALLWAPHSFDHVFVHAFFKAVAASQGAGA